MAREHQLFVWGCFSTSSLWKTNPKKSPQTEIFLAGHLIKTIVVYWLFNFILSTESCLVLIGVFSIMNPNWTFFPALIPSISCYGHFPEVMTALLHFFPHRWIILGMPVECFASDRAEHAPSLGNIMSALIQGAVLIQCKAQARLAWFFFFFPQYGLFSSGWPLC